MCVYFITWDEKLARQSACQSVRYSDDLSVGQTDGRTDKAFCLHSKKRLACNNVVENRPGQYFAAHIVPGC
jgi:hypothetical protein